MLRSPLTLAALLVVHSLARAADLPVTYSVQDKPLKKLAVAGTPLTFTLYSDATCTQQVYQATIPVENVTLISTLKLVTPKGATKAPTTDDIRTTLAGVNSLGNVYLKVTGAGVTPRGGSCQAQAPSVQGPTGLSLVVKDANGATIGISFGGDGIGLLVGGAASSVGIKPSGFEENHGYFYYASADCTGPGQLDYQFVPGIDILPAAFYRVSNATLYRPPTSGTLQAYSSVLSYFSTYANPGACGTGTFVPPDGCCYATSGSTISGPPLTRDVSGFVPPFRVE